MGSVKLTDVFCLTNKVFFFPSSPDMWDLSYLTGDRTCTPCSERTVLTIELTGKFPNKLLKFGKFYIFQFLRKTQISN